MATIFLGGGIRKKVGKNDFDLTLFLEIEKKIEKRRKRVIRISMLIMRFLSIFSS